MQNEAVSNVRSPVLVRVDPGSHLGVDQVRSAGAESERVVAVVVRRVGVGLVCAVQFGCVLVAADQRAHGCLLERAGERLLVYCACRRRSTVRSHSG